MASPLEKLQPFLARYQATTLGALALWRIALGTLGVYDVVRLWQVAPLFFSDEGVYPRVLLSPHTGAWGPLSFVAGGWLVHAIFAICMLGVLCFLLGVRFSRPLLCFSLLVLHNRIPQLRTGGEAVFQIQAGLAMFLPVNEVFALNAFPRPRPKSRSSSSQLVASWIYPLVLLQLAINYLFNFLNKLTPTWLDGTALSRALGIPTLTTELGGRIGQMPELFLSAGAYGTLAAELALAALIASPWRRRACHRTAAILMLALHGGIALTMEVGIFSATMLCHLPLLWLSPASVSEREPHWETGWRREVDRYAAVVLTILLLSRLTAEESGERALKFIPKNLIALTNFLGFRQGWGMFMHPPDRDYAVVTRATTRSGRIFDPWRRHASGSAEPLNQLRPGVMTSHLYARYENGILDWRSPHRESFGEWLLKQSSPKSKADRVTHADSWFINVPTEPRHRVTVAELPARVGLAPLPLGKSLPVKIVAARGTWMPGRAIDGLSVPEGSHVMNPIGTAFNVGCSHLTLQLAGPTHVRTVYLQSDSVDEFVIETSTNGKRFEEAAVTARIDKRQYRSRVLHVDVPEAQFIRLRPKNPRPLRHFVAEVALYSDRRELPVLSEVEEAHFVAAYAQPAALGVLMVPSPASQECSWPADLN